ncbi:MAG: cache domain-containing protein, partial [Elusimicrobiota bacterium]
MTLKVRIFLSFFIIILLMGSSISLIGHTVIEKDIIQREQKQVSIDLRSVENVFNYSMNDIITELLKNTNNPYKSGDNNKLDYMLTVTEGEKDNVKSEIVLEAFKGNTCSGTRIIEKDELLWLDKVKGTNLYEKSKIEIKGISNNSNIKILEKALAMEYALPLVNKEGIVEHVLYGGKILNRNTEIVDKLRDIVFNNNLYDNKHVGTVTIFLQDIRVSTNIMNEKNERAI